MTILTGDYPSNVIEPAIFLALMITAVAVEAHKFVKRRRVCSACAAPNAFSLSRPHFCFHIDAPGPLFLHFCPRCLKNTLFMRDGESYLRASVGSWVDLGTGEIKNSIGDKE